jgi:hypothetical protein
MKYILAILSLLVLTARGADGIKGDLLPTRTNLSSSDYVFGLNLDSDVTSKYPLLSFLELTGKDFRRFGANPDAESNDDAWENAMEELENGDTLIISGEVYTLESVDVSKDISIVGVNGGGFRHKDNATGHMLNWTVEGNGEVTGLEFDANIANQGTNTQYAILYPNGGFKGLKIHRNTFNGFHKAVILDYQTRGKLEVVENGIFNGYKVPLAATNVAIVNAAVWFAPGLTNNSPELIFSRNRITNTPPSETERLPGGVIIFGAESVNHFNYAGVTHNFFDYVSGDSIGVAHHVGTAVVDWYRHTKGIMGWNTITNAQYFGAKIQQSSDVLVIGNSIHSTGSGLINYSPMEREQSTPQRRSAFVNNYGYIGSNDTIGFYLSAGEGGGFYETLIDGFYYDGTRGIQIEGFDGAGDVEGYGPVVLKNVHVKGSSYGLLVRGMAGRLKIEDSTFGGTNTGSGIIMIQTNTLAIVSLDNVKANAEGSGWGLRAWGVGRLSVENSEFTSASGEDVELQDDADGNNIGAIFWERSNKTPGTVEAVTADIDAGYFWNGSTVTHYPSGWTVTLGNGTSTYLEDSAYGYAGAALGRREGNMAPGGAWLRAWIATNATGSISIFGSDYSDSDRADRFSVRAESNSALDLDSMGSAELRIRSAAKVGIFGDGVSTRAAQFDGDATAGNTRFLLWDVTAGSLKRVGLGASDSGGTGYKLLRVAN